MTTAFIIGSRFAYEALSTQGPSAKKRGAARSGIGSRVWRTREEAEAFLGPDRFFDFGAGPVVCGVYGLVLAGTWDTDVSTAPEGDGVHRLLVDARIFGFDTDAQRCPYCGCPGVTVSSLTTYRRRERAITFPVNWYRCHSGCRNETDTGSFTWADPRLCADHDREAEKVWLETYGEPMPPSSWRPRSERRP